MRKAAFLTLAVVAASMGATAVLAEDWSPRPGTRYFDEGVYVDRVDLPSRAAPQGREMRENTAGGPVAVTTVTQTRRTFEFYDEGSYREAYPFDQPSFR